MAHNAKQALWWGKFDPNYSRNRIMRHALCDLGWTLTDFHPRFSALGDLEAWLRGVPRPDLVWVPGFRQRDVMAARRWSRRRNVPLLFDPLISAYGKQVFERRKFAPGSPQAERLRRWEAARFNAADMLLIDTKSHFDFYTVAFGVQPTRTGMVPLGAEEPLFSPAANGNPPDAPFEVLFFGSFITLHGTEIVAQAACLYHGPPVRWHLVGKGPARAACEKIVAGRPDVVIEDWKPYLELPKTIALADLALGVFGTTPQAERSIPNKIFQSLACGRPVLTRISPNYPGEATASGGLILIPPGDPVALAKAVETLARDRGGMPARNQAARALFEAHYSRKQMTAMLGEALATAGL